MKLNHEQKTSQVPSVAMTGAQGFLGWHTKAALRETDTATLEIPVGESFEPATAVKAVSGSSRLIHIAGVNRAPDNEIYDGNVLFAEQIASSLRSSEDPPSSVVYANSVQAGNGTVYGEAKAKAGDILAQAASDLGIGFVDLRLPNLFGEHGRPFYNSVTATFSHILAEGGSPKVEQDRELTLLHAQNAADLLTGAASLSMQSALEVKKSVSSLLDHLTEFATKYRHGEIPNIASDFDRDLFNTYRSHTFDAQTPINLTRHADGRGSFFEIIRSHGGSGQSAFSTTVPGVSRGDHYHRRKVERFTVLAGQARISLRRLFTDKVFEFDVDGESPVAIDMPTMWAHRIINTGSGTLYTSFWTNDLFDPASPDTITEEVKYV